MSSSWLRELYQAAVDLDDDLILDLIKQIPQENNSLVEKLTYLVNNFQLETITKLTEQC